MLSAISIAFKLHWNDNKQCFFFSFVLNVKILNDMIFSFFKIKLAKLCVISAESVCQQFDVPLLIISYIDVKTLLSPYDIWSMLNSHPFSKDYPTKERSKWIEAGYGRYLYERPPQPPPQTAWVEMADGAPPPHCPCPHTSSLTAPDWTKEIR